MKQTILLFMAAFTSFFVFAYIDEYESLILPFFKRDNAGGYESLLNKAELEGMASSILTNFNATLSDVYLSSDLKKVSALPAGEELKREIRDELIFFRNKGLTMDVSLKEINIIETKVLSIAATEVSVRERAEIRYLIKNGGSELPYREKVYGVRYTLIALPEGLVVAAWESISLEGLNKEVK